MGTNVDPAKARALIEVPDALDGARVRIRPFLRADAPALQAAIDASRDHLRPWMPWADGHRELSETLAFCAQTQARWIQRDGFGGGLYLRSSGELLGGIGLQPRDWRVPSFEIGYWLRPAATGCGYVREGVAVLAEMAFGLLGAERVMIRCDARNERSRRVAEACGFTYEGAFRHDSLAADGSRRDTLHFAMLRAEYDAVRRGWERWLGAPAPWTPRSGDERPERHVGQMGGTHIA